MLMNVSWLGTQSKGSYRSVRWWSNSHQLCGAIWQKAGVTILTVAWPRPCWRPYLRASSQRIDIPQPPGQTATNEEEAALAARKIGFLKFCPPIPCTWWTPWKSLKTKKTFRSTCELPLRPVQTTPVLVDSISLGKRRSWCHSGW